MSIKIVINEDVTLQMNEFYIEIISNEHNVCLPFSEKETLILSRFLIKILELWELDKFNELMREEKVEE